MSAKKILVIEDEQSLANVLEFKLSHEGFITKSVTDGSAALKVLTTEKFDLILLDLVMPVMDGFQVLEELKKRKISTPVIVLTNLNQAEDEKKVMALGAKGFFVKTNISVFEIVNRINRLLK